MQHAPLSIENAVRDQCMILQWDARDAQRIGYQQLRAACPCAKCRAGRMQGRIALVDAGVQLVGMQDMVYGLQLVFSDGHDRGIYPWAYLRELKI